MLSTQRAHHSTFAISENALRVRNLIAAILGRRATQRRTLPEQRRLSYQSLMTDDGHERVALYARYSSDMQSRSSAQDQIDLLSRIVAVRRCKVVATFLDEGLSGATLSTRPQALALLEAARQGKLDLVMCEALDRLSRDQEDTARIFKHLTFAGVRLETLSEGCISELHVGLSGTMNQLYLAELARKTRRGLMARVRAGFSGGGRCYGYTIAERGVLQIDPMQGATVQRIFTAFAAGHPASAICEELNAEGVAAPRGDTWRGTTLLGNPRVGDGILCQELYVGRRVFNRRRFRKHPETGRRSSVINPPQEWLRQSAPELRIIDDELWSQVQARRAQIGRPCSRRRRPKRLLSGLLVCASCGGSMTLRGGRYGCSVRWDRRSCSNGKVISAKRLELRVLEHLLHRLGPVTLGDEASAWAEQSAVRERLASVDDRLSRLRLLFVAGEMEMDDLRRHCAPLQKQRLQLGKRYLELNQEVPVRMAVARRLTGAHTELDRSGNLLDLEQVRSLLDQVKFIPTAAHGSYQLMVMASDGFEAVAVGSAQTAFLCA